MALLVTLLLLQDPAAEIDRLVRDLGHELIEERERAQKKLIEIGPPAIPGLRKALGVSDAEHRARTWATLLKVDRMERERDHDARELAELLRLNRPEKPELWQGRPWTAYKETAGFNMGVGVRDEGAVIYTECQNFLTRHDGMLGRYGEVEFDLKRVESLDGASLALERCATCSPRQILVKDHKGPVRILVAGAQTWFSRYEIEFMEPQNGQSREVGDMTVEVQWPNVIVRSKSGLTASILKRKHLRFEYDLKPGASCTKPMQGIGVGGFGCGGGRAAPPGWCECPTGPVTPARRTEISRVFEFRLTSQTGDVALDQVQTIKCVIWKPIEIPIEFTVNLKPFKADE